MALSDAAIERYSRQIILPMVGGAGQERLAASSVVLIGCGGLGCPAALGLAGAGVGHITLVDPDRVELSNLPRQVAFGDSDIGRLKVECLAEMLRQRCSATLVAVAARAEEGNLPGLIAAADLVLDGSDNFATRFAVADACVDAGVALISGAVAAQAGQLVAQAPGGAPCYRCLFESEPTEAPSCDQDGVLPGAVLAIGGMMVQWALLALLRRPEIPFGTLVQADLVSGAQRPLRFTARPTCRCAGR